MHACTTQIRGRVRAGVNIDGVKNREEQNGVGNCEVAGRVSNVPLWVLKPMPIPESGLPVKEYVSGSGSQAIGTLSSLLFQVQLATQVISVI